MNRSCVLLLASCLACSPAVVHEAEQIDDSPLPAITGALIDSTGLACEPMVPPSAEYGRIFAVAVGTETRLGWADPTSAQFTLRDAHGVMHTVGKRGDGDGEFQLMASMGWQDNRLWVSDLRQHRVQFFDDAGKFQQAVTLGDAALVWTPRPDGRFLGLATRPPEDTLWAVVAMREGKVKVDTIATFPAPKPAMLDVKLVDGSMQSVVHPFAAQTWVVRSDDGRRWCGAIGAGPNGLRLKCVSDVGKPIYDTSITFAPRAVPSAVFDSALASLVNDYHAELGALLPQFPPTSPLPIVNGMRIDARGDVWINRSHPSEATGHWVRIRRDGALRDTVVIPSRLSPKAIRNDTLWSTDFSVKEQQPVVVRCVFQQQVKK